MLIEIVRNNFENIVSLLEYVGNFIVNEQKKGNYNVITKPDKSLLTDLDIMSEKLIKDELTGLFGKIGVISEENDEEENIDIVKNEFFFLLDPIDGTENFHNGKTFTINLAFCVKNEPKIGFIHSPLRKTTIFSDGECAYQKTKTKITKLQHSNKPNIIDNKKDEIKLGIGVHNFRNIKLVNEIIRIMNAKNYNLTHEDFIPCSAMEKVFSIVEGKIEAFFTSSKCKDWDILPSLPILNAIGLFFHTKNPKVYKDSNFNSGAFFVANNEDLLNNLLQTMRQIYKNGLP